MSKIFWAQVKSPEKNDWCTTVKEDLNDLNIQLTFEEISSFTEERFKQIVKEKVQAKALQYLNNLKEGKSKMKHLEYNELQMQDYLVNNTISLKQKKLLFSLRVQMARVSKNYGGQQVCPLRCGLLDTQENILQCSVVQMNCYEVMTNNEVQYMDIYSSDPVKIEKAAKLFDKAITVRNLLIEKEQHM